ncbi:MAG: helix-turn-helix domain-containing protein [Candidatus Pacebacteria bacterium]|nr:helix-turn-helix domain-containing protein [Candidatus Paceibacterota bacterium]MBP9716036.1 helix-turn-helix domain-containing protein [Candidatus Paceibacterota bacterium]
MENTSFDIKKSLLSIGFSEKEIEVYLALLELGKGTVTQIARKAGINRPTAYHVLASLELKKLVRTSGKEPKQEYTAESPENIEQILEEKISEYTSALKQAKEIIPELVSIHNKENRPKIKFYEGKDGLQKVYEDTLSSSETILAYASVEDIQPTLPHYFPEYYKRRAKKGIPIRAIFPDSPEARERASLDKEEKRESVIVPDSFGFHPEINIYDNKVMIASWREKLGIIIESAEIADAMKKIYELAWSEAKRLEKEI